MLRDDALAVAEYCALLRAALRREGFAMSGGVTVAVVASLAEVGEGPITKGLDAARDPVLRRVAAWNGGLDRPWVKPVLTPVPLNDVARASPAELSPRERAQAATVGLGPAESPYRRLARSEPACIPCPIAGIVAGCTDLVFISAHAVWPWAETGKDAASSESWIRNVARAVEAVSGAPAFIVSAAEIGKMSAPFGFEDDMAAAVLPLPSDVAQEELDAAYAAVAAMLQSVAAAPVEPQ
jgi:hypothetical protein